jgi:hypothetical protein
LSPSTVLRRTSLSPATMSVRTDPFATSPRACVSALSFRASWISCRRMPRSAAVAGIALGSSTQSGLPPRSKPRPAPASRRWRAF